MNKVRWKIERSFYHFITVAIFRVKVIGKENIPETGKVIICGNHGHALDAPVMFAVTKRPIRFVAKEELYKSKFIRYFANFSRAIAIKRETADTEAIREILKGLKDGDIIGIFPEGTRNGMAKHVELKSGAAYIALKTDTPIIPFAIKGNFKPFSKNIYKIGKPMDLSKYKDKKNDKATHEQVTKEIMDEVMKLYNEI